MPVNAPAKAPRWFWGVTLAVVAAVLVNAVARRFFGVDFTDESYPVALARRFAQGDRLFADEVSLAQGTALFLTPWIWLHRLVAGDEGLVLSVRMAHLIFQGLVGAAVADFARRFTTAPAALLAGAIALLLTPFNAVAFSYNTLGAGLLTMALFLLGSARFEMRPRRAAAYYAAAGFAFGGAAACYPPLALAGLAASAWPAWDLARGAPRRSLWLVAGAAVPALALVVAALLAGPSRLAEIAGFAGAMKPAGSAADKLATAIGALAKGFPFGWWGVAVLAGLAGFLRRRAALAAVAVAVVAAGAAFSPAFTGIYRSLGYGAYLALAAPFVLPAFANDARLLRFAGFAVALALGMGLVTAWSSTNGYVNFFIGAQPALFVFLVGAMLACGARPWAQALAGTTAAAALIAMMWTGLYRDDDVPSLRARIPAGAYAGLYTSERKAAFVAGLSQALAEAGAGRRDVFVYDAFPGGYLLTPLRAAADTLWILQHPDFPRPMVVAYWERTKLPDVVVRLDRFPKNASESPPLSYAADPISTRLAAAGYAAVTATADVTVLLRRDAGAR